MTPTSHFFTLPAALGAYKLHYLVWGEINAHSKTKPLVCVHGLSRNARDFDFVADAVAQSGKAVICVDMLGRGQSDWAKSGAEYAVPIYAKHIAALLDSLQLTSVDWLGTSMGGMIGLTLSLMRPELISKMILNDIGPVIEAASVKRIADYVGQQKRYAKREDAVAYGKTMWQSFGAQTEAEWGALINHYFVEKEGYFVPHYDPAIADNFKLLADNQDPALLAKGEAMLWLAVQQLRAPSLLLRGAQSDLLTAQTAEKMCAEQKQMRCVEIANTGHAPHLSNAKQAAIVVDFFAQ